ncbi:MAG: polysaccharide pyruvyl transferase family protein [Bacteroidota bacterium]
MNILIDNAGFINKGAELMLRAVIQKSKEKYPASRRVINPHAVSGNIAQAIGEGLYIYRPDLIAGVVPQTVLSKIFSVKANEIDLLLDAGGFQFSDQWINAYSEKGNQKLEKYYKTLKDNKAKLVFLPQAFGPFTLPLAIDRIKIVYKYADVLFARERISYDYLVKLFGESDKIVLMPDFTNLLKPKVALAQFIEDKKYVCVIPNLKMVSHTSKETSSGYIDFLIGICQDFIDKGEHLVLLNHEGIGDEEILNKIQAGLSKEVLKLNNLNALEVKAVIGKMKLLISSRFHGVVSGLSQGVVTFCTGWSHKYPELLADYKVPENLLDIGDLPLAKQKVWEALSNSNSVHHVKPDVITSLERQSGLMWEKAFSV